MRSIGLRVVEDRCSTAKERGSLKGGQVQLHGLHVRALYCLLDIRCCPASTRFVRNDKVITCAC